MKINDKDLRKKIIDSLKSQGFHINPHLRPKDNEKETLKMVHKQKRREQLKLHKKFLVNNLEKMKKYLISGKELDPENISIKLIEVKSNSCFSKLFLWWNLIWWSIPYNRPIGRQMRFILWDEYHNSPLGLFCLQSPILRTAVRDKFLNLKKENIRYSQNV